MDENEDDEKVYKPKVSFDDGIVDHSRHHINRSGSIEKRRQTIFQHFIKSDAHADLLNEETKEKVIKKVEKAMKEKAKKIYTPRPLKRFGVKMVVALVHHTVKSKSKVMSKLPKSERIHQRKLVLMEDKLNYNRMPGWIETCLGLNKGTFNSMLLQYHDTHGHVVSITGRGEWNEWLDQMWMKHPPQLHIYESSAIIVENEVREDFILDIFLQYDTDNSGFLSMDEIKEMLLSLDMDVALDLSKEEIMIFVDKEFKGADEDGNGEVSYEEFVQYFNQLQEYIKERLLGDQMQEHAFQKYAESTEARSYKRTVNNILWNRGGILGSDYGIRVVIDKEDVDDENKDKWIQYNTLLTHKVEHFVDHTDMIDQLFSSVVQVHFEEGLDIDYRLHIPTCFGHNTTADMMIVCYAEPDSITWNEVESEYWEFTQGDDHELPYVDVKMPMAGTVAVFSKANHGFDLAKRPTMRIFLAAMLPDVVNPLESEVVRIYALPEIASEIEYVFLAHEMRQRGAIRLGGLSDRHDVKCHGTEIEITVMSGDQAETHVFTWEGVMTYVDFDFDPEHFEKRLLQERKSILLGKESESATDLHAELKVKVQYQPLGIVKRGKALHKPKPESSEFTVDVAIHEYPAPSEPVGLTLYARTYNNLMIKWMPPLNWGGCALSYYEIELRERTNKDVWKEWEKGDDGKKSPPDGEFGALKNTASLYKNFYAGEVRIRAYNVGSALPGPWKLLTVGTIKEEASAEAVQRMERGRQTRKKLKEEADKVDGAQTEAGMAVVEQDDLGDQFLFGQAWTQSKSIKGLSAFAKMVASIFISLGVPRGVEGVLFDLKVKQIEELVEAAHGEISGLDNRSPLISLCSLATWVIDTLAHYAHDSMAGEWIAFMNDIAGLVQLAAAMASYARELEEKSIELGNDGPIIGYDPSERYLQVNDITAGLIGALYDIYETLRQCEDGGYIQRQLCHKYDKSLRKLLGEDFELHMLRLHNTVAFNVMKLVRRVQDVSPQAHQSRNWRWRRIVAIGHFFGCKGMVDYMPEPLPGQPGWRSEVRLVHCKVTNQDDLVNPTNALDKHRYYIGMRVGAGMDLAEEGFSEEHISFPANKVADSVEWIDEILEIPLPPDCPAPLTLDLRLHKRCPVAGGTTNTKEDSDEVVAEGYVKLGAGKGRCVKAVLSPVGKNHSGVWHAGFDFAIMPFLGEFAKAHQHTQEEIDGHGHAGTQEQNFAKWCIGEGA